MVNELRTLEDRGAALAAAFDDRAVSELARSPRDQRHPVISTSTVTGGMGSGLFARHLATALGDLFNLRQQPLQINGSLLRVTQKSLHGLLHSWLIHPLHNAPYYIQT